MSGLATFTLLVGFSLTLNIVFLTSYDTKHAMMSKNHKKLHGNIGQDQWNSQDGKVAVTQASHDCHHMSNLEKLSSI